MSAAAIPLGAYPKGPPPGRTGGFDEAACNQCHKSFELNAGRAQGLGDLAVSGLPEKYEPGKTYPLRVEVQHTDGRMVWGFQLAARASGTGAQAGVLATLDERTQIQSENGVQYVTHTADGIFFNAFEFNWTAPGTAVGDIVVNVAGNAANGDAAETGDYIYSTSVTVPAASH